MGRKRRQDAVEPDNANQPAKTRQRTSKKQVVVPLNPAQSTAYVQKAFEHKKSILAILQHETFELVLQSKVTALVETVRKAGNKPFQAADTISAALRKERDKLSQLTQFLEAEKPEAERKLLTEAEIILNDEVRARDHKSREQSLKREQTRQGQKTFYDIQGQTTEDFLETNSEILFNPHATKKKVLTLQHYRKRQRYVNAHPKTTAETKDELVDLHQKLQILKQTLQCHEQGGTASTLQQHDFYVANDVCNRCHVPFLSLPKESRLVCPQCSRPKTAYMVGSASSQGSSEAEGDTNKASDRNRNYRAFLQQFREGTRVPPYVLSGLKKHFYCVLHMSNHKDYMIGRVKETLELLGYSEWLPYLLRITLQLMELPMPSLMNEDIDIMVDVCAFVYMLHQQEKSGEAFPNAKRITEMICIWLKKPSFARCFVTARTPTKRPQFAVFDKMTRMLEESQRSGKPIRFEID